MKSDTQPTTEEEQQQQQQRKKKQTLWTNFVESLL